MAVLVANMVLNRMLLTLVYVPGPGVCLMTEHTVGSEHLAAVVRLGVYVAAHPAAWVPAAEELPVAVVGIPVTV